MRQVRFPAPAKGPNIVDAFNAALRKIENASNIDAMLIAQAYSASNYTVTRTIDIKTATLPQLANFIATFLADLKAQGASNV